MAIDESVERGLRIEASSAARPDVGVFEALLSTDGPFQVRQFDIEDIFFRARTDVWVASLGTPTVNMREDSFA